MEWSFIVVAIRRRIRFVVLCTILGALPGLYSISKSVNSYESVATVAVVAPTTSSAANQPDRYVVGQLSVVTSHDTLEKAAKQVGNGVTTGSLAEAITVEQQPSADLLTIKATADQPKLAAAMANAVADVYIADALSRQQKAREPEITALNTRLTELQTKIDAQLKAIKDAMAPLIDAAKNSPSGAGNIPAAENVVPEAVQQRDSLIAEYNRVQAARADIEFSTQNQAVSSVVERAVAPTTPKSTVGKLVLAGGLLLGLLIGTAVALVLAQLSSKVLDESTVADMLGTAVVGTFPRSRALLNEPMAALKSTPIEARDIMERLSVRAEAMADPDVDHALTIAVVGTQTGAGTTTLTLALARRLSRSGYSVVIVDGDTRTQTISEIFDTDPSRGIRAVLDAEVKKPTKSVNYFTDTDLPNVVVLGVGKVERREALRRDAIGPILDAARERGQIVLYDGGSLMGSALTLFASKAADVIVLAVPLLDQDQETLIEVADNLPADRSRVLAVTTSPMRRRNRRPEPSTSDTSAE
ncbi:MAG TPA: hypothetical protein PLV93_02005 [Microthrixaceae bacterium]|nr:hypothetical protein [Microthrixaceae bacterium]HNI34139.1 hypothetical protein [Microthrixaceae bacterium]